MKNMDHTSPTDRMICLFGVKEHNLKNIDIKLPLNQFIVLTGPSGSGKSTLAFSVLYAEGQRRYMTSMSSYARQFMERFPAPLIERIENIPPTIALSQVNPVRSMRATVGTSTELYDHIRLLFEKLGVDHCPHCKMPLQSFIPIEFFKKEIVEKTLKNSKKEETLYFGFTKKIPSHVEEAHRLILEMVRLGYSRVFINGSVEQITIEKKEFLPFFHSIAKKDYQLSFITDRRKEDWTSLSDKFKVARIHETFQNAIRLSSTGEVLIFLDTGTKIVSLPSYKKMPRCSSCGHYYPLKESAHFSFHHPLGACQSCHGFGNILSVDINKAIPHPELSIYRGAIDPLTKPSMRKYKQKLEDFCFAQKINMNVPFQSLSEKEKKYIIEGKGSFAGLMGIFKKLEEKKYKIGVRMMLHRYQTAFVCKDCSGSRLGEASRLVKILGYSIAEISDLSLYELSNKFINKIKVPDHQKKIASDILEPIKNKLSKLISLGIGYVQMSRVTRTLSGGEYQRLRLATQLSLGLTESLYILDEPTVGLHPRDTNEVLKIIQELKNIGNTILCVEHDPEVVAHADHVILLGPHSGVKGGTIMYEGDPKKASNKVDLVSDTWLTWCKERMKKKYQASLEQNIIQDWLTLSGASLHNLKHVTLTLPLHKFVVVTGVSGSGKSSLIVETLFTALQKKLYGVSESYAPYTDIEFPSKAISDVVLIDATSLGRSSRTNPITYIKAFDNIRNIFAQTEQALQKKIGPEKFSFNVPGGRCEHCQGEGRTLIDMVFLEDVHIPCEVCAGKRYQPHILNIRYKNKNIDDVLNMTVDEAMDFFEDERLKEKLSLLKDVGLAYLTLGQMGSSLSGGEVQRIKIVRSLLEKNKDEPTIFIFDEPSQGLHFTEINNLIFLFEKLISKGHSIVVIEHNIQIMSQSDYIIDIGPESGNGGGEVVCTGHPYDIIQKNIPITSRYLYDLFFNKS